MKQVKLVFVLLLVTLGLYTCRFFDDDDRAPDNNLVYNDDGGFVITYGMLRQRYNAITFPGTHNSYAGASWPWFCENQGLTISEQLENGIRYIELDIGMAGFELIVQHGPFCWGTLDARIDQIIAYVQAHPQQVFTVRISDLFALSADEAYERMNAKLVERGLDQYIYNWDPAKPDDDPEKSYIPDPWPTLGEMIGSAKTVMFFHSRDFGNHGVFDEGLCPGLSYSDTTLYYFYDATEAEQLCRLMPIWAPPRERQQDGPDRLFLIEVTPDASAPAGDKEDASKNNDGRRLYQLAKQHEEEILPLGRVVNFINVDYYMTSNAGPLPIDTVDASNRLNYERFGYDWKNSDYFWESYPYEFDNTKTEIISQIPAIRAEIEEVIADHRNKINLDGHEDKGLIVSTTYETEYDWKRLPEWALDGDLFTRWTGSSSRPDHTWGIDLGESKSFSELAIAWEFIHKAPAYTFYVSNDDGRFADGISNAELLSDDGWLPVVVQLTERPVIDPAELWDRRTVDLGSLGLTGARYLKIKVTDADSEYWPSFYEVRIY